MKTFQKQKEGSGLLSGVFTAYFILLLHILLLALLGCLVLFFRGFVQYMLWIFLGGTLLIGYSGYRIFKKMKTENKNLREVLQLPMFRGQEVEVSILGGFASLKVGNPAETVIPLIAHESLPPHAQLEEAGSACVRELSELAHLYESGLITPEEFRQAKDQLFKGIKP
ncbi:MAG: SHOCT domain-containing protein [Desulfobacterales bacterium]